VTDDELLRRAATGELPAFRDLVVRHRAATWRAVRARVPDDATGEDVLQETWIGAWRAASSFRGESSVRSWLLGLARRQAARSWRRRVGEPTDHEPLDAIGARAGWGSPDPERAASVAEDHRQLHAALARLPDEDREVLLLRDVEGLSGPEAAEALGLALSAMKSRLHRARLRLMAALREEGTDEHA
jgi:RNA polymerase sigma-70 factor (ECF subfamily)